MKVIYVANDGEKFDSAVDCANHEKIAAGRAKDYGCRCYNLYLEVIQKDVNEVLNEEKDNKLLYIHVTDRDRLLAHLRTELMIPEVDEFYNTVLEDNRETIYTFNAEENIWLGVHSEIARMENEIELYKQDMKRMGGNI